MTTNQDDPMNRGHRWRRARCRGRFGFTLVELLVVIAIIGVLLGIMLPAIGSARDAARRTQCASRMRQVGLAYINYANSSRGRLPGTSHTVAADEAWIYKLAPFLEDFDAVRICPDDPHGKDRASQKQTSYVLNVYLTSEGPPNESVLNYNKLKATSKTMVTFELADHKLPNPSNDHVHNHLWFKVLNIAQDKVYDAVESEITTDRHQGVAHYLYADGHVEAISADQIFRWCQKGPTLYNFVLPR